MAWTRQDEEYFQRLSGMNFGPTAKPEAPTQNTSAMGDLGTALKIGVQRLPGAATGLLDIPVAALTGRALVSEGWDELGKATGFQPGKWADESAAAYSPRQQAFTQEAQQKTGFLDTVGHYASNPLRSAVQLTESIPSIAAGGVLARAGALSKLGGYTRAGIGEGAVMGGQHMQESLEQGIDPRRAAAAAGTVGAVGGLIGGGMSKLASRYGISDIDVLAAGGGRASAEAGKAALRLPARVAGGALSEGVLEEMPQSALEAVASNWAGRRDLMEGVPQAAGVGLVLGGMMGGVMNVPGARKPRDLTQPAPTTAPSNTDLLGDTAQAAAEAPTAQRSRDEILADYKRFADIARSSRDTNPELVKQATAELKSLQAEMKAAGISRSAVSAEQAEKRLSRIDKEIEKLGAQFDDALLNSPDKAAGFSDKIQSLTTERAQLAELFAAPEGQLGLFDDPVTGQPGVEAEKTPFEQAVDAAIGTSEAAKKYAKSAKLMEQLRQEVENAQSIEELQDLANSKNSIGRSAIIEAYANALTANQPTQGVENEGQETLFPAQEGQAEPVLEGRAVAQGSDAAVGEVTQGQEAAVPVQEGAVSAPPRAVVSVEGAARTKLAPVQQSVFDHMVGAMRDNRADDIVDAKGVIQYAKIGRALNMARGGVKVAVDGAMRTIAKQQNMTFAEFKKALRDRAAEVRTTEGPDVDRLGLSPAEQVSQVNEEDIFGSEGGVPNMEIVASPGQTNAGMGSAAMDEGNEAGTAFLEEAGALGSRGAVAVRETVDPVAERRAAEARAKREAAVSQLLSSQYAADAAVEWDDFKQESSPWAAELDRETAFEWTLEFARMKEGEINAAELAAAQLEIERELSERSEQGSGRDEGVDTVDDRSEGTRALGAPVAEDGQSAEPEDLGTTGTITADQAGFDITSNPIENRAARLRPKLGEKQLARLDKLITRYAEGEIDLDRVDTELEQLEQNASLGVQYSAAPAGKGTTVDAVWAAIDELVGGVDGGKVTVVQSAQNLVEQGILPSQKSGTIQGYVKNGRAYFIADNIKPGNERAVFMHEVGAHLGLQNVLNKKQFSQLVDQMDVWLARDDGSIESKLAAKALARVARAGTPDHQRNAERIAYFVEEAVKAGIDPTALSYRNELTRWFHTLWSAFRAAIQRLGFVRAQSLTAQDVIDLAYGAAQIAVGESPPVGRIDVDRIDAGQASIADADAFMDAIKDRAVDAKTNFVGFAKRAGLGWLTMEQMADVVKSKAVSAYQGVMVSMQKFSKDRIHEATLIDADWARLTAHDQERLSTAMRDARREQFDPSSDETPKGAEQEALSRAYNALTPEAKGIYARVRDYYQANFDARRAIMLDAANKAKLDGRPAREVERLFAKVKGPYFPLMRLGQWYSVGMSPELAALTAKRDDGTASDAELKKIDVLRKDAAHYITRGHQSRAEAKRSERELKELLGVARSNIAEEMIGREVSAIPDVATIEEYVGKGLPTESRAQVRSMLAQMYFDLLPEQSALKRQMKSEDIHGEEKDMRRVFAASSLSAAHHISRLKYSNDLSEALVKVKREGAGANETMKMVGNELVKRTKLAMEESNNPLVDRVLQVSYFTHLGLSPAFILTNMSQVPMITAPWLGARHGYNKSISAIATAYADTTKLITSTYAGKGVKDGWRSEFDWSSMFPEGTNEDNLFREMLDRNLLDITMEHDLGAVAEARFSSKIDDAIKIANLPVRVSELANRSVTALAAYRLAIADGKTHEQAVDHAAKALSETQLNYSGLNAARHMQSVFGSKTVARIMMQFRKYQQGMVYLIAKNAFDAIKAQGGTPEETAALRAVAKRTLLGLFGTTGLMAGAVGIPFFGSLAMIANIIMSAAGDGDEPWDAEVEFRNFLTDMLGAEGAAVAAKGIPTFVGLDLSRRVGLGDIGTPLPFVRQGKTGTESVHNILGAAAGASVSSVASMWDGVLKLAEGDYLKGAEKIIPVKAAQNLIRGYRYNDEGLTNSKGELIVPAEKFSAWDIALRTAGFQPMRESEYYAANQAVEGAKRAAMDTRSRLLRKFAQTKIKGEQTADIEVEIAAFNTRHPEKGLRIDGSSKVRAVQSRRKMASERNETGVRIDRTAKAFEGQGRFAAP